jgi:hypothetical protein
MMTWWFLFLNRKINLKDIADRIFMPKNLGVIIVAPDGYEYHNDLDIMTIRDVTNKIATAPHEIARHILCAKTESGKVIIVPNGMNLTIRESMILHYCEELGVSRHIVHQ